MATPGWYPDPAGRPGAFRYWDGEAWGSEATDNPYAAPPGGTPDRPGYTLRQMEDAVRRDLEDLLNTRRPPENVPGVDGKMELFFGGLDPRELTPDAFAILRAEAPFHDVAAADVAPEGDPTAVDVLKLLVDRARGGAEVCAG